MDLGIRPFSLPQNSMWVVALDLGQGASNQTRVGKLNLDHVRVGSRRGSNPLS